MPFAIKEMKAKSDGFELTFTKPVDVARAGDVASYRMTNYTLFYSGAYGSDEIQAAPNGIVSAKVASDGLSVRLKVDGLRELYIHELHADGIRSAGGEVLDHADAYYTLNRVPKN